MDFGDAIGAMLSVVIVGAAGIAAVLYAHSKGVWP